MAVDLLHLDLVVGEGGHGHGVPVHQALAAIDQPVVEQPKERLPHRRHARGIHREPLALPVTRAAHEPQLSGDLLLVLVLPSLDPRHEVVALEVDAPLPFRLENPLLDDGLRRDSRVIRPRHPERVPPLHAAPPHQDVLERVVEGVPHVQRGGDVRRRDDDGVGRTAIGIVRRGVEGSGLHPSLEDLGLDLGGLIRLGKFRAHGSL